jgi:hypothetical protein
MTIEVWIVMDENGNCEVATDEAIAIDRWKGEFGGEFEGEATCRVVKLNIAMSRPRAENGSGAAVDVVVPDDAGHHEEVETE